MLPVPKFFKDCLTEADGATWCPFRIAGVSAAVSCIPTFVGLSIYTVVFRGEPFHPSDFSTGFGGLMMGIGVLASAVTAKTKWAENAPIGEHNDS